MVEIKRKKGETFESFLRRFNKRMQQSGKIILARKQQFFEREKSRNLKKQAALMRNELKAKKEYLKKIGKLKEENNKYKK